MFCSYLIVQLAIGIPPQPGIVFIPLKNNSVCYFGLLYQSSMLVNSKACAVTLAGRGISFRASALNSITHPLFSLWRQYVRPQILSPRMSLNFWSPTSFTSLVFTGRLHCPVFLLASNSGLLYVREAHFMLCALVKISTPKSSNLRPFLLVFFSCEE